MKKIIKVVIPLAVLLAVLSVWQRAGAVPYSANHGYTCLQTSVTSATVPTAVATPGFMTTWLFHVESGAATGVYIFPYTGTLPTAVPTPSPVMEVAVGAYVPDAVTCDSQNCLDAMGQGWAGVLTGGSTAVKFDACTR